MLGAWAALPIWLMFTGRGSSEFMTALLIVYIAAAYVVAWAAVASDRRGSAWRFWPARSTLARIAGPGALRAASGRFGPPFDAQVSYEWGCHGLMLNGFVGVMLFLIWGILLVSGRHAEPGMVRDDHRRFLLIVVGGHDRRDGVSVRPVQSHSGHSFDGIVKRHIHRHAADDDGPAGGRQVSDGRGERALELDAGGGRHDLLDCCIR